MPMILTKFGTQDLPQAAGVSSVGTGSTVPVAQPVVGGSYDAWATGVAPVEFPYDAPYSFILAASTAATLLATYHDLTALLGQKLALTRKNLSDGVESWCWARLTQVPTVNAAGQLLSQPLQMLFQVWSDWYGEHHQQDNTVANGANPITLTNAGNKPAHNPLIFTITSGNGEVRSVTITNATTGHSFTWSGRLYTSKSLVINIGNESIINNGMDAYDEFTRPSNKAQWMMLAAGGNSLSVTLTDTGTGSVLRSDFYDTWM